MILDACCGSRAFWFDKRHDSVVYIDNRQGEYWLKDMSKPKGGRWIVVGPDLVGDFTSLPFVDDAFSLVVFDPPHSLYAGKNSNTFKMYGTLRTGWEDVLKQGFSECFRVLKPTGTLVFKWNEMHVPVSKIIPLSPYAPLIGNRCGKAAKSHWIVFMKPDDWRGVDFRRRNQRNNPSPVDPFRTESLCTPFVDPQEAEGRP